MLRISIGIFVALVAVAGVDAVIVLTGRGAPYTEIVQTTSGPIRGEELTFEGMSYKAFKGIPYAAPPVGILRFKGKIKCPDRKETRIGCYNKRRMFQDPQPPENWTTVRDTRTYGNICHQPKQEPSLGQPPSSEDCLTLNVFTPSLGENGLKPVLVWIHGGGFIMGDGTDVIYGPQYLLQDDVVVVTLNYRLGPLGFLSTNTPDASGNWGMKDQVAALRWVQRNIANFGGDPNQVTIYGESAGGASVHLHLFSPLSRGLFHKVIAGSGTGVNSWSAASPERASTSSIELARLLGASEADITDPAKRVEFLRKADPQAIVEQGNKLSAMVKKENPLNFTLPFTPCIENPGIPEAFLTERPKKLLLEGRFTKTPVMLGTTDLEGGAFSTRVSPGAIREMEKNVCAILPEDLVKSVVARNECNQVAREISDAYFGGKPFDSSPLSFAYLMSDLFIIREAYVAQKLHARLSTTNTPVYNYIFAFDGEWNRLKKRISIALPGAIHADELGYVFMPESRSPPGSNLAREIITKNRMVRFITNFVKHGNPTPTISDLIPVKWEPATVEAARAMVIGNELKMENEFLQTRMGLWDRLYERYTGSPQLV